MPTLALSPTLTPTRTPTLTLTPPLALALALTRWLQLGAFNLAWLPLLTVVHETRVLKRAQMQRLAMQRGDKTTLVVAWLLPCGRAVPPPIISPISPYISPTSPLHLPCGRAVPPPIISPTSPYISPTSPLHLPYISPTSPVRTRGATSRLTLNP